MISNPHILITGADGFVGRHLSVALLATGSKVTKVVRSVRHEPHELIQLIALDLTDRSRVAEVFSSIQPSHVIHLAGSKDRNNTSAQFRDLYETNLSISLNVIEACLDLHNLKKLVFLGSCDEYGQASPPFDETQREMPTNVYGLSKLAVTKMLSGLYQSRQFPSVILRPTVIYGPNQGSEMFLSALIQSLLAQKDFAMTYGEQLRDFVYIDDVVDAIIKSLHADDQINGETLNIGAGFSYPIKNIAMLVANLIHSDADNHLKFGTVKYRPNEAMDYAVNITRAAHLLDWRPTTQLADGLQQTINHFRLQVGMTVTKGSQHCD